MSYHQSSFYPVFWTAPSDTELRSVDVYVAGRSESSRARRADGTKRYPAGTMDGEGG